MNNIKVILFPRINDAEINIQNLYDAPFFSTLSGYWTRSADELKQYLEQHNIQPYTNYPTLYELERHGYGLSKEFSKIFAKEGTGGFDFRLAPIIKDRWLKDGIGGKYDKFERINNSLNYLEQNIANFLNNMQNSQTQSNLSPEEEVSNKITSLEQNMERLNQMFGNQNTNNDADNNKQTLF